MAVGSTGCEQAHAMPHGEDRGGRRAAYYLPHSLPNGTRAVCDHPPSQPASQCRTTAAPQRHTAPTHTWKICSRVGKVALTTPSSGPRSSSSRNSYLRARKRSTYSAPLMRAWSCSEAGGRLDGWAACGRQDNPARWVAPGLAIAVVDRSRSFRRPNGQHKQRWAACRWCAPPPPPPTHPPTHTPHPHPPASQSCPTHSPGW